jgi:DNA-binding NtrC family response regulator
MKHKIVIIDDDESILDILRRVFEHHYEVFTACGGADGIELIKKERPFFVFLDINMPGMSGMRVLEHIEETGIPTMVWMLTAEGDLEVALKAMGKGATGYLTKPFDIEMLIKIVMNAVRDMEDRKSGKKSADKPWSLRSNTPEN